MKINQFVLANGLNIFLLPIYSATSVVAELMVRAGSKDEKEGNEGLAHFLEHLAFKGTKKWPTGEKFSQALDKIGAVYNAYTDKENTAYWIKTAPEFLSFSLEALSQMWLAALIKKEELEIERGVIIEEINMYNDHPREKVDDFFEEQIFGNNPLGRATIGKKKSILNLTRKDFLEFKKSFYRASNMSLVVAGKIQEIKKVKQEIKKFFAKGWQGEVNLTQVKVWPEAKEFFWQKQKLEQTHFVLGVPTVKFTNKEKYPLKVLATVLGGSTSSRLWQEIREKRGLAYYILSFSQEYPSGGFLAIKAGVNNFKAKEAIEICRRELLKIAKDLKKKEIAVAKQVLRGRFLISLEDPITPAELANRNWLFAKRKLTPKKILAKIAAVDYQQVVAVARKFLKPENIRLAAIGPKICSS